MSRPEFILKQGSLQQRFLNSRAKFQVFGGGFGNGKTTSLVIKALQIAEAYPGSSGLLARSTYPKLNDTLRKEFIKWCPKEWIKSFPVGQNASNICTLKNGSTITFRYIAQQGKGVDGGTSNLLSANYDWIGVDQIEDPEISYKDFMDLLGRLRGATRFSPHPDNIFADDPAMPRTGPRWVLITCNPTSNWVYTKIVRPLQFYKATGQITEDLLCVRDVDRKPVLNEHGAPRLLIDLFEGSTYELAHIHEADGGDFIQTLESTYTGQQRDRYLLGKWASYEGLIYPQFDTTLHGINRGELKAYLALERAKGYKWKFLEAYDFGQAEPSCYGIAAVSPHKHVLLLDGYYKKEMTIDDQIVKIKSLRSEWAPDCKDFDPILADPSIFARKVVSKNLVGKSIARMFEEDNIKMRRGNNDIINGIVKVGSYLKVNQRIVHPITNISPSPYFFYNNELTWFSDEMQAYHWKSDGKGERVDVPADGNDHAMDMVKYLLSTSPDVGKYEQKEEDRVPSWMRWHETPTEDAAMRHRYG